MKDNPLTLAEGKMLTWALENGWTHTGITRLGLRAIEHEYKVPSDRNKLTAAAPQQNKEGEMTDYNDTWLADDGSTWAECWQCGGEGYIEGECTCGEDCCCCFEQEPPTCDICRGKGAIKIMGSPSPQPDPESR